MSNTPWKSEKWYVSPWNFADDVTKDFNFADKIIFHDVSLRDGEQQAGLIFNAEEKVAIAERLAEMGIQRIEAGMPAVSPQDKLAIETIVKKNWGPKIFAFGRCMVPDVEAAADCGVDGVVIEIPSSEHLVKHAYQWEMEKAIELSIKATQRARELGLYTVFFPIDATRADIDWFLKLIKTIATEGHMDALACVDTMGALGPSAVTYLIKKAKEVIGDKPVEAHFHDDFGLGAANTILAATAGAEVLHTTISGIGERAGNAPYEDVALSLLTMYGIDTGIKYDRIYETSRFLQEVSGLKVRQNRGITGEFIHNIESGIVVDWFVKAFEEAPLELSPYRYDLTGHPDWEVVIGKNSGLPTVDVYLDRIGLSCDDKDTKMEIVKDIKAKAYDLHRLLTVAEFEEIARKHIDA
jgi:isopropylmalate/homocitrate/citramalate synthase